MDTINQSQMNILKYGGNAKLMNFLKHYDLVYEPVQRRYHTQAAEFYRQKLKEVAEVGSQKPDIDFTLFFDKPSYDDGRKPLFGAPRPSFESALNTIENEAQSVTL